MTDVYKMLDSGKSVKETAEAFKVSVTQLYYMHYRYQDSPDNKSVTDILNSIYQNVYSGESYYGRATLANRGKSKKYIDMEEVYRLLDAGRPIRAIADSLGVSVSTIKRRHREYQEMIRSSTDEG